MSRGKLPPREPRTRKSPKVLPRVLSIVLSPHCSLHSALSTVLSTNRALEGTVPLGNSGISGRAPQRACLGALQRAAQTSLVWAARRGQQRRKSSVESLGWLARIIRCDPRSPVKALHTIDTLALYAISDPQVGRLGPRGPSPLALVFHFWQF